MVKMLDADFDDVAEAIGRFVYKNKDAGGTPGSAACWKPVSPTDPKLKINPIH